MQRCSFSQSTVKVCRGNLAKALGERRDLSPSSRAGKRELLRSGSSDSAWAGWSVTAAKAPDIQEQPLGSMSNQQRR